MQETEGNQSVMKGIVARFSQILIFLVLEACILFLASGRLDWIWAWVFLGAGLVHIVITGTILLRTSPETIAERGRPKEIRDWDKIVSGLYALAQYIALPLVAGLDARFGWTGSINIGWNIGGLAVYVAGGTLGSWAMIANAYFSTAVRIQTERGHTVCHTGPYRFVRHPGYVGFITQSFGIAILLGSVWALVPAATAAVLMITRTSMEDRTLQAELPGYLDYVKDVRYRLVPGIW